MVGILVYMPRLHTQCTGSGPTIVMLHGFLSSMQYFKRLRRAFEHDFTVITVDLLGSGGSPKPEETVTYGMQISALHETLTNEAEIILVGHSMGAVLAARYALKYPKQVTRLVLFNPPLFATPEQARHSIESTGLHYRAAITHPRSRMLWRGLKALPRVPSKLTPPLNFGDMARTHYHAREGGYQNIIVGAEFVDDLSRLSQPTLVVRGVRDRYVYAETLKKLVLPPHITLTSVQTGHHTIVTKPSLAEQLIRSHLLQ